MMSEVGFEPPPTYVDQKKQRSCDAIHSVPPDKDAPGMFLGSVEAGHDPWSVPVEVDNSPVTMNIATGVIPVIVLARLRHWSLVPLSLSQTEKSPVSSLPSILPGR
eukprot:scpid102549/ scgid31693/ 